MILREGGALAYQEVKGETLPPLTHVISRKKIPIIKNAWKKDGTCMLKYRGDHALDINYPIIFQNQSRKISEVTNNTIFLHEPVKLRSNDFIAIQEIPTAEPRGMHDALNETWNQYFQRDPHNDDPLNWEDAVPFLNAVHSCQTMDHQPITANMLQEAIQTTKIKSARGVDGFSTLDLRKLPWSAWDVLAHLLNHIEAGNLWPDCWMTAKTLCLPKSMDSASPLAIRPVTILSKIYRLWARIRGQDIAKHLASQVPPTIGGPCKGISSDMFAMFSSELIEEHILTNQKLCGAVIDIVECYDGIPRIPLRNLLCRLGVCQEYIHAFMQMLEQMQRRFEIAGHLGPPTYTTTGIVEGCGVAVACMLAVAILFYQTIEQNTPHCTTIMFADNWALFDDSPQGLLQGLNCIVELLRTLKMELSTQKSWLWALTHSHRVALKEYKINDENIPVVLHAKDSGVDQNYSKRRYKPTTHAKWEKVSSKLRVIKKTKLPRNVKKRLAVGAGLSIKTYGVACALASKMIIEA